MVFIKGLLIPALLAALTAGPGIHAAEFEVLDKFSVDGYSVFRGSADIPGGSFAVGGSVLAVKGGRVGVNSTSPDQAFTVGGDISQSGVIISSGPGNNYFAGNLGVGTTGPGEKLEVYGNVKLSNAGIPFGVRALTPTYWGYSSAYRVLQVGAAVGNETVSIGYDPSGNPSGVFTGDGREVLFRNGVKFVTPNSGNTNFNLTNLVLKDGNAGIGTADPAARLHVYDTNVSSPTTVRVRTPSGSEVVISTNGYVGVGTTNPVASLDIAGTGSIKIPFGTTGERPSNPANGMLRLNTTTGKLEYYNSGWNSVGAVVAAGGNTVVDSGGYRTHTFTASGTLTVTSGGNVEILVVAGGGGGGGGNNSAGGGGAGGMIYNTSYSITPGAIAVTVGAGGAGGTINSSNATDGGNSVFATLTAIGGGEGAFASGANTPGSPGGSGGGGGSYTAGSPAGGAGTSGQGNNGGSGYVGATYGGGGGGGAGGAGANAAAGGGGAGGVGLANSISGSSVYYAGGGGGGAYVSPAVPGTGGLGGGGTGGQNVNGTAGTANTGGGGGGGGYPATTGGAGGSGIVIIRYQN